MGGIDGGTSTIRDQDRQIGWVRMWQDRYVARRAGSEVGTLETPLLTLNADWMSLNVDASQGWVEVRVLDESGQAVSECDRVAGSNRVDQALSCSTPLGELAGIPVQLEFKMQDASLYAFTVGAGAEVATATPTPTPSPTTTASVTPTLTPSPTTTATATATLMPGKASIGDYVWNDLNQNGIQEDGEPGLANVRMQLYARNASGGLTPLGDTFTDGNGLYRFFNLTPGEQYRVRVYRPDGYLFTVPDTGSDDLSTRTWVLPVPTAATSGPGL